MKIINKLLISSLLASTALSAMTYEYPSLYKDPRIMGMGGANIAVGGEAASLFHNPAGLSQLDPKEGLEVDIINLNIAFSENTLNLIDDLDGANTDTETFNVLEKYQGSNNHITINDYSSVSYKHTKLAWSVGVLGGAQMNFQTHALGSSAGLLDVNGYIAAGLVGGVSYDWNDKLNLGIGLKSLSGKGVNASLTLSQVLTLTGDNTDTADYIEKNFMSDFSGTSVDLGAIYNLESVMPYGKYWHPKAGISLMNIGDTSLGKYGTIPMTVNLGYSVQPDFPYLSDWLFAIDYIDLLNGFDENYDADMAKKWRMGVRASLFHNSWIQMTGSAGLYNANSTFGLEFRLAFLTITYASYAEAIGAYADQNIDRRNTISLSMGW